MSVQKMTQIAFFIALASVIHYAETFIVIPIPIPGFKLGLANIVSLFVLFYFGIKDYLIVNISRVFLVSLLATGFGTGFLLSLSGAFFSTIVSVLVYSFTKSSCYGVSIISALFHSTGQICMYMVLSQSTYIIYYLPYLGILSMLSGFLLSIVCSMLLKRLPPQLGSFYNRRNAK